MGCVCACDFEASLTLALELGNGSSKLRDRRRHVGQLDDVGIWGLGELTESREVVGDLLIFRKVIGEVGQDAPSDRDVRLGHLNACGVRKPLNNRQKRVRGKRRSLIGVRVNDFGARGRRHEPPGGRCNRTRLARDVAGKKMGFKHHRDSKGGGARASACASARSAGVFESINCSAKYYFENFSCESRDWIAPYDQSEANL